MYRLFVVVGIAIAMLFLWEILNNFTLPALFFLLATIGFSIVYLRWALMRLELTSDGLTVYAPLQPPLHIFFRQLITCTEAGRTMPGLSFVYWPITADGVVHTDTPRTLFLPAVEHQEDLFAFLQDHICGG